MEQDIHEYEEYHEAEICEECGGKLYETTEQCGPHDYNLIAVCQDCGCNYN